MIPPHIVGKSEEFAFLEAVRASAYALLESAPEADGKVASDSGPTSRSQHQTRAEVQRALSLALDERAGSYGGIYSLMHEYSNSVAAGIAFNESDEDIPITFAAFEVVFRHSTTGNPRIAEIPPKPYMFREA